MPDELSIKITREKDGSAPSLTNMSLDAAQSVKVFIESFTEYARAHSEDSHIKILDTGNAIDNILTLPEADNSASDEILDVVNSESESDNLVKVFNLIRKRISENGLSYEVNLKHQDEIVNLTEKFKSKRFITKQQADPPLQEEVVFVRGMIYESGGMNVTNIHIKPKKGKPLGISCSQAEARKFSKLLYSTVFVSAVRQWKKPKDVTMRLLDVYKDEEQFERFQALYHEYTDSESSERFNKLREDLISTLTKFGAASPRISRIMRLYNHALSDRGIIRTILFILKPLRHEKAIASLYDDLATVLKNGNTQHSY
ncbi:hypothetical protein [Hymenobacter properus]|uniref:Uncharacterized protein n=1 Tax=Hymenobacter properus TaxID=2791026 RepID=A0A931FJX7_9BACT|nr:hypothetical protein [Hymenobacter properus]MBF9141060.1 hypothetical protein [Hymenobacter properus]MBR7719869.1 hypothetical protein [Microvirga sp. SRT04]